MPAYPYPSTAAEHNAWCRAALMAGLLEVDVQDATLVRLFADWLMRLRPDLAARIYRNAPDAIVRAAGELGAYAGAAALGRSIGMPPEESRPLFDAMLRQHWQVDENTG